MGVEKLKTHLIFVSLIILQLSVYSDFNVASEASGSNFLLNLSQMKR